VPVRRALGVAVAWVVVFGLAWGVVGLPERCPPATVDSARAAAEEAVGWFARNQRADGHFVYRYDRDHDVVDRRDHVVRQAGVTMSLYQAHAAGIDGALGPADDGADWLLGETVRRDGWAAVGRGGLAPTGGTALLVAALSVRKEATGDDRYDEDMAELGAFLVAMTEPSGAVLANWDVGAGRPVPGEYSPFFTGETYFALALLAGVDPGGPWGDTAARIGRYLPERDDVEDRFPPTSDHWGAYGLAESVDALDRSLAGDEEDYARRLAGMFGIEVRWESQRTGEGAIWLLRGPHVIGAGLGTIGEGLGSLWRVAPAVPSLARHEGTLSERLRCVAGMLVDRQVDADEAESAGHPERARGAWFSRSGVTQMDDQQHSLSALLLAEPALAQSGPASGGAGSSDDPSVLRILWLGLIAVAAVNPPRVRRIAGHLPWSRALPGAIVAGVLVGLAALAGGPVLRAIDVSPATALIAAGVLVAVVGVVDAVRRAVPVDAVGRGAPPATGDAADARSARGDGTNGGEGGRWRGIAGLIVPLAVPALVRPSVTLLALAVAAETGGAAGAAVAVATVLSGAAVLPPAADADAGRPRPWAGPLAEALRWAVAAVAVLGGIDLAVHGVFAV
jgi:hypothetical protein